MDSSFKIETQLESKPSRLTTQPFICQICGVMLKIDQSIEQISETQYKQLSASFALRDDIDAVTTISDADIEMYTSTNTPAHGVGGVMSTGTQGGLLKSQLSNNPPNIYLEQQYNQQKLIPPRNLQSYNSMSESMMIQNINSNSLITGMSSKINSLSALFDLMSTNTNIDHPLCEECADQLVNQLDIQCKLIQKEHTEYTNLINKLNEQSIDANELNELEDELKNLEEEEAKLISELEKYEIEEAELKLEVDKKKEEEARLVEEEEKHQIEYYTHQRKLFQLEERQSSLDNQLKYYKAHFNRLRSTNVLNAAFYIWHSGAFGTINFFRLGYLPDNPVEWDEINAGLGQVTLLLNSLALKMKLDFKRFKLIPYGNYSYIQVIDNVSSMSVKKGDKLHLYGSGGFKYYFDWDKKFDYGLWAFLDCLQQLEDKIKLIDNSFSLPYIINGSKLVDKKTQSSFSIMCHFNSPQEWTKALKYMLTNLKWSLAWVASQSS